MYFYKKCSPKFKFSCINIYIFLEKLLNCLNNLFFFYIWISKRKKKKIKLKIGVKLSQIFDVV